MIIFFSHACNSHQTHLWMWRLVMVTVTQINHHKYINHSCHTERHCLIKVFVSNDSSVHNSSPWCRCKNSPSHSPALLTWFGQLTPPSYPKIIVAAQSGGPWLWSFCVHEPDPFTAFVEKNDKADIISSCLCLSARSTPFPQELERKGRLRH